MKLSPITQTLIDMSILGQALVRPELDASEWIKTAQKTLDQALRAGLKARPDDDVEQLVVALDDPGSALRRTFRALAQATLDDFASSEPNDTQDLPAAAACVVGNTVGLIELLAGRGGDSDRSGVVDRLYAELDQPFHDPVRLSDVRRFFAVVLDYGLREVKETD